MKKNSAPQNVKPSPMKASVVESFNMEKIKANAPGIMNATPILLDGIDFHLSSLSIFLGYFGDLKFIDVY